MNSIRAMHETAMEFADRAILAKAKGEADAARQYLYLAFQMEKKAAFEMPTDAEDLVPRFILLRSAAALAFKAGLFKESENLIEICRSENPPAWILAELDDVARLIQNAQPKNGKAAATATLEGVLTEVNSIENEIIVEDAQARQTLILVPRPVLREIVKKHWAKKVNVVARQTPHGVMVLEKISAAA